MTTLAMIGDPKGDPSEYVRLHALEHVFVTVGGFPLITKFGIMAVLSGFVLFVLARAAGRRSSLVPVGVLQNAGESLVLFIRDQLVRPSMGHHGDRFVPFFCTLFAFIYVTNMMGMIPIPGIGGTATSNLGMTGMLAASVLLLSIGAGIKEHGIGGFLHTFIPPGVPKIMLLLLFPLELIGFFIKHAVLAIRLFANMIAGHLVIGAFIATIFIAKSYGAAVIGVPLALFANALELLVCFLQAYVFTMLSVLFVGGTVHPEH
ncbi:MAG TPA: F0F1 ATP synthase subunit A [Planctomycetota bacterium]|nr:F0F1 ATP synthase subunit A [Planctomycetota bacterium]